MKINNKNIFFAILSIFLASLVSFSYNIESRAMLEATIQSGIINYPGEFNLMQTVSVNSWSLPIQLISILIKSNISTLIISRIIILISTLMFFIGIYLVTKSITGSSLLALLVSFLVIFLRKNFGLLDYPTVMFSEHTNSLLAQALSTLIFGLLVNNNIRLSFFFSALLLSVHLTIGLWVNLIIFLTLALKSKIQRNLILDKKVFIYLFLGLLITSISFFYGMEQKIPLIDVYDDSAYKTYMKVWEAHRTGYGLYSDLINYNYIAKTLVLILLVLIFLKLKSNKDKINLGINILLVNCVLALITYIIYKFFYSLLPDIIIRIMPSRYLLLHSIIGWPIIFSIFYILTKNIVSKFYFNFKYFHYFFVVILIINLIQHHSKFIQQYQDIKLNVFNVNKNNKEDEFWNKIKTVNSNGYLLTSSEACVKTVAFAKKRVFFCPDNLDFIPYFPSSAGYVKKIVEEVFDIPFDNPEIKYTGGIGKSELKSSYENKSYNNWVDLKKQFNISGLIVPKKWKINLEVFYYGEIYNFYLIQ
jgi:hypothetical protein|tara:strand:- start:10538 stop:12130 length:1593 start_codon:yes stop_codon:yes gene_type:complete